MKLLIFRASTTSRTSKINFVCVGRGDFLCSVEKGSSYRAFVLERVVRVEFYAEEGYSILTETFIKRFFQ